MPMNWDTGADAKLLLGILKIYDVKINKGPQLEQLNAFMGPDCVGQSITNHINRLKKSLETGDLATDASATSVPKTPKTPKSAKRKNLKANGDEGQDGEASPTKKHAGTKVARTPKREMSNSADEDEGFGEDIKQERSFLDNHGNEA